MLFTNSSLKKVARLSSLPTQQTLKRLLTSSTSNLDAPVVDPNRFYEVASQTGEVEPQDLETGQWLASTRFGMTNLSADRTAALWHFKTATDTATVPYRSVPPSNSDSSARQ